MFGRSKQGRDRIHYCMIGSHTCAIGDKVGQPTQADSSMDLLDSHIVSGGYT